MKNRLFYFATCVALALSSVSCSSDDDGEEDIDIPVVGKIAVSGAYNVYSHGSQGWIEADKIGTVSYTHLTLPTINLRCRSRWSPYH